MQHDNSLDPIFCDECNRPLERPTVAVVLDRTTGIYVDRTWNWESAQTYAQEGCRVVAVADDGIMDVEKAQKLYDYELECYKDCFAVT